MFCFGLTFDFACFICSRKYTWIPLNLCHHSSFSVSIFLPLSYHDPGYFARCVLGFVGRHMSPYPCRYQRMVDSLMIRRNNPQHISPLYLSGTPYGIVKYRVFTTSLRCTMYRAFCQESTLICILLAMLRRMVPNLITKRSTATRKPALR